MALKRMKADINVIQAAETRIINIFKNGLKVYMGFSAGKDSLVLAHLVVRLIQQGKINPKQLIVQFIDEEAIFPCVEKKALEWRKKFLLLGATFEWYCLEVKHFNCFNELSNDESFICWDNSKEDVWIRRPPAFAIRNHPKLNAKRDTYQTFCEKRCHDGLTIIGIRAAESLQRLKYIALMFKSNKNGCTNKCKLYPIYDWSNDDVWLYIKEHKINIPDIYLYLWQIGTGKAQLRVSQFFSIDTARSLVRMNEYYPNLMDSIIKREPNTYLAALYWDSEMFGRRSRKRKILESTESNRNYRSELTAIFSNMGKHFNNKSKLESAKKFRDFFLRYHKIITDRECQDIYENIFAGDPKSRNIRALFVKVFCRYANEAKAVNTRG